MTRFPHAALPQNDPVNPPVETDAREHELTDILDEAEAAFAKVHGETSEAMEDTRQSARPIGLVGR